MYFTIKEQEILEKYINSNMNIRNLVIPVSLYIGLKLGNLCVLKGSVIDFINNYLPVVSVLDELLFHFAV